MIPIVFAIPECQRYAKVEDIPCNIISTWNPGSCGSYTLFIYNTSGVNIENTTWGDYNPVCNATFNISLVGTYHYDSDIESGIITVKGDDSLISAIITLIPLVMAIVFMIGSFTLSERHSVLKWYFMLMSLISFYIAFHFGLVNVVRYMNFPELQDLIGSTTYWYTILIGGVFLYLMIYLVYMLFTSAARKKQERLEY